MKISDPNTNSTSNSKNIIAFSTMKWNWISAIDVMQFVGFDRIRILTVHFGLHLYKMCVYAYKYVSRCEQCSIQIYITMSLFEESPQHMHASQTICICQTSWNAKSPVCYAKSSKDKNAIEKHEFGVAWQKRGAFCQHFALHLRGDLYKITTDNMNIKWNYTSIDHNFV